MPSLVGSESKSLNMNPEYETEVANNQSITSENMTNSSSTLSEEDVILKSTESTQATTDDVSQNKAPVVHSDTKDSLYSVDSIETDHNADISDSSSDKENTQELPDFEPPDNEAVQRIIDQVEFYFSDSNITKDAFLLKHVRRNKEGYVSLKLISSFKRVKHLAKDWRAVAYALKKSKKLEVNQEGTKLRRIEPLPSYDQTAPSRTVVAIGLPPIRATVEAVAEAFKNCGEITLVRILRPGNPVPADVRKFLNKHPETSGAVCALVEFSRTESAHNSLQKEWSFNVVELITTDKKKKKKELPIETVIEDSRKNWRRRWSNDGDSSSESSWSRRGSTDSDISAWWAPTCKCRCSRRGSSSSEGYASGERRSSLDSRRSSFDGARWNGIYPERRLSRELIAPPLLRMPRGPDGGRGFHQPTLVE